jgi:hypothetical protein
VARPRDPAVQARNAEIYQRWYSGESVQQLAERYDRKPVVIARIIKRQHPEQTDDANRSMMRGRLEWLLSEMREVIVSPGVKLGPNGRPAEDFDGEPLPDLTTKIEASKVYLATLAQIEKNDGSAKPPPQDKRPPQDVAMEQMWAAIAAERARLQVLNRQPGVVPGEVIAELPPGQPAA